MIGVPSIPAPILRWNGIPFPGVGCNCAPPDTNGEVGKVQQVQMVNEGLQVLISLPAHRCLSRYGFHLNSNFLDYPKLGVWPDGYYMAANVFNIAATAFLGPQPFCIRSSENDNTRSCYYVADTRYHRRL